MYNYEMKLKKRDWSLIIGLFFIVWSLDRITKIWAVNFISDLQFYGPIGFVLHNNYGVIFGGFSNLPPTLRIVTLSTGGAFLVFIYAFIQYLLPRKLLTLRCGLSILLGGIIGNVSDRILFGYIIDFVTFGFGRWLTPIFNVADALQWAGYGMILYALTKSSHYLWPQSNERKERWIKPHFQYKYIFILITTGIGFSLIAGTLSYTYLKIVIEHMHQNPVTNLSITGDKSNFTTPFLIIFTLISLTFTLIMFILGLILSHRTAGPMHAFETYLEALLQGEGHKVQKLKLRAGDEFTHLEELADKLHHLLSSNFIQKKLTEEATSMKDNLEEEP